MMNYTAMSSPYEAPKTVDLEEAPAHYPRRNKVILIIAAILVLLLIFTLAVFYLKNGKDSTNSPSPTISPVSTSSAP